MVFEGFSKFSLFENDLPNGAMLAPKINQPSPKNIKKHVLKTLDFWMWIFFGF